MKREEYNACVSQALKNKQFTSPERKLAFCVAAKKCSGKASSEEEATQMCKVSMSQPKVPKTKSGRGSKKQTATEPFDTTTLIPKCEGKLQGLVKSGELPTGIDVTGICELILG